LIAIFLLFALFVIPIVAIRVGWKMGSTPQDKYFTTLLMLLISSPVIWIDWHLLRSLMLHGLG
jgi:hypothetical protein